VGVGCSAAAPVFASVPAVVAALLAAVHAMGHDGRGADDRRSPRHGTSDDATANRASRS
jgi:hypothetical protein